MNLEELRKKIDHLDKRIVELLSERTQLAAKIGHLKNRKGSEVYSPDRESEIYARLGQMKCDPLSVDALKSIYREIMSASLVLERPLRISYLGPEATFTHLASLSKFGSSVEYRSSSSIPDVFLEVDRRKSDYGVVPIENTTEGAVTHTLDMFMESDLKICSEIIFEISHTFMSNSVMDEVKRVYSNPQVFGQCRLWLREHLAKAELIETSTTTMAAKRAAQEDGAGAIASRLAATLYNVRVIEEAIEDSPHNRTRFLVIGQKVPEPTGHDKVSILASIKDRVGALYDLLDPIRQAGINLTKIESRPSKKKAWDYYFFIDMEGHVKDPKVKQVLKKIEENVRSLKVLGSYPSAKEKE